MPPRSRFIPAASVAAAALTVGLVTQIPAAAATVSVAHHRATHHVHYKPRPATRLEKAAAQAATLRATAHALHVSSIGAPRISRMSYAGETGASPCAVDVTPYLAHVAPNGDDTAGFAAAMAAAVAQNADCYPSGPSGHSQAVVYVPAGTYRLANLYFPSNLRMEVDAGAVLQQPANRYTARGAVHMIEWDTRTASQPALQNVTLTGVGSSLSARKAAAIASGGAALASFDLSRDFTMNLDPASTGSTNYNPGIDVVNVQHFEISNLFSIQNATDQRLTNTVAWPTSARAVIEVHARKDSPLAGPFLQPKYGLIANQVNIGGPRGYGPNQFNAGDYLTVNNIYSHGGTALRMETDGSTNGGGIPDRGAKLDHLVASNIVGVNCNRAVSLSPHAQRNGTVTVSGVWAYSCNQGVVAAYDSKMPISREGSFASATVSDLHVNGAMAAQLDSTTYLWVVGESRMPVYIDAGVTWNPKITLVAMSGVFARLK